MTIFTTPHADVTVVVDGAVENDRMFTDYALMEDFIAEIAAEAHDHGYLTEVYVMYHDHEVGIDCECAQFVTDHHPLYTFNGSNA
jgi:hypothetical protein